MMPANCKRATKQAAGEKLVKDIAILLDRDGTIIEDKHYLADPSGVAVYPGVGDALASLQGQGIRFFVVSNQSGIGRGYFRHEDVVACNQAMAAQLAPFGVRLEDTVFCPHDPDDHCACRKPGSGMWEMLQKRHDLAAATSVMAGDKGEDMLFAANAGLWLRVLVLTGKGENTAAKLGLALPEDQPFALYPEEARPEYPHLLLRGLHCLPQALACFKTSP